MTFTAGNKRVLQGGISSLPDELMRRILKHVDFDTKVQGHAVCRKWNEALRSPCDGESWGQVRFLNMTDNHLEPGNRQKIQQYTDWLIARAVGISCAHLVTEQWQSPETGHPSDITEARYFIERQLPYLLGHLHPYSRQMDMTLTTDAEFMTSGLLHDHKLLTSLGQNLVGLTLTAYSDGPAQLNIDLDCLSSMSNLQHLHIHSGGRDSVWQTHGLLSSLTALESFTFLHEGKLHGPLLSALGMLPKLTAVTTSSFPWGNLELCSTQFRALKMLKIASCEIDDVAQNISFSVCQPFDALCDLRLVDCRVTSAPVPLKSLPNLTRVSFTRCDFDVHSWLSEALGGAAQNQILKLKCVLIKMIPRSICWMSGLKQLNLQFSSLQDLPAELVHLTNLEVLDVSENDFTSVPEVLEQMTHLQDLDIMCCDFIQLTRPLTFFSTFANLRSLSLSAPRQWWNSSSMFHLGEMQAALDKAFMHRSPTDKPYLYHQR